MVDRHQLSVLTLLEFTIAKFCDYPGLDTLGILSCVIHHWVFRQLFTDYPRIKNINIHIFVYIKRMKFLSIVQAIFFHFSAWLIWDLIYSIYRIYIDHTRLESKLMTCKCQSWALALFFQVRSPHNWYPWIAIALLLILQIFRFAHHSVALKKISNSLFLKSANNY